MNDRVQADQKPIPRGGGSRVIRQRPVTFRCAWCGHIVTELRFPGPTPTYGLACKAEAMRYTDATKKARQRGTALPQAERTTSCWDSPANLLVYGYVDPKAEELAREAVAVRQQGQLVQTALAARQLERANEQVRRFLEECGL